MINHLNNLIRHLLLTQITGLRVNGLTDAAQIRFQPPDEAWRNHVSNLTVNGQAANALNVYLTDLRENRKLRSNERIPTINNGMVTQEPAPARLDCHYLITAWSPAQPDLEPTLDEHALLYEVTSVLTNNSPLVPRRVYTPGPLPGTFPPEIADAELPTSVLPVEGFPKLAEFWGTMGTNHRWKPAVYLVVTLPVLLRAEIAGPMVTTSIIEYRQSGRPETAEVWIQIGSRVLDTVNLLPDGSPAPVAGAWVRLEDAGGTPIHVTHTAADGRFTFSQLRQGTYVLRVRAQGHAEASRNIEVPSPTDNYDVTLT